MLIKCTIFTRENTSKFSNAFGVALKVARLDFLGLIPPKFEH